MTDAKEDKTVNKLIFERSVEPMLNSIWTLVDPSRMSGQYQPVPNFHIPVTLGLRERIHYGLAPKPAVIPMSYMLQLLNTMVAFLGGYGVWFALHNASGWDVWFTVILDSLVMGSSSYMIFVQYQFRKRVRRETGW